MHPEHRVIGELAYRLWQARGCPEGSAEKDWLDAEKQLRSARRAAEERAAVASEGIDTARASRPASTARPRRSKATPGKPSTDPPG